MVIRFLGLALPEVKEVFENEVFCHMMVTVDPIKSSNGSFVGLKLGKLRGVKSNKFFGAPNFTLKSGRFIGIGVSGKGVVLKAEPVFILSNVVEAPATNTREESPQR